MQHKLVMYPTITIQTAFHQSMRIAAASQCGRSIDWQLITSQSNAAKSTCHKVDKPVTTLICGQLQGGHIFFTDVRMFHKSNSSGIIKIVISMNFWSGLP